MLKLMDSYRSKQRKREAIKRAKKYKDFTAKRLTELGASHWDRIPMA